MKRFAGLVLIFTVIAISVVLAQRSNSKASAEALLKQITEADPPRFDESRQSDQKYVAEYIEKRRAFNNKMLDLAKQFYEEHPDHPQAIPLMLERWASFSRDRKFAQVLSETDEALKHKLDEDSRTDILFLRAYCQLVAIPDATRIAAANAIDAFVKAAPKDERGAELLLDLSDSETDVQTQKATYQRIAKQYEDSIIGKQAVGTLSQLDRLGKPFELKFTDAISGKTIDVQKDWKGKIVVIDFWATWCPPCVEDMPKLKALYEKYREQGVEFVGVSLDNPESAGGLEELKKFVAQRQIPWPQYYQGKRELSEFSSGWGIVRIPVNFVIDADGNLFNNNGFQKLDKLVPEAIAKRDKK